MTYDPSKDGAEMDFRKRMSYGDYLRIDQILTAQEPLSTAHDEMLFIVQHQASELWMKLALYELAAARTMIAADRTREALKMLARVARIFEQLNSSWDVLRTMTPSEYTGFRDDLGQSSGFQSWQYRLIEYAVGNRNLAMLKPHEHRSDLMEKLEAELARPSLYDEVLRRLFRLGLPIPEEVLNRDLRDAWKADDRVMAVWATVYREPSRYWEAYEMAEKLVDFEDYFRRWRFNHVTTVERVIGFKRGTAERQALPTSSACLKSNFSRSSGGCERNCSPGWLKSLNRAACAHHQQLGWSVRTFLVVVSTPSPLPCKAGMMHSGSRLQPVRCGGIWSGRSIYRPSGPCRPVELTGPSPPSSRRSACASGQASELSPDDGPQHLPIPRNSGRAQSSVSKMQPHAVPDIVVADRPARTHPITLKIAIR